MRILRAYFSSIQRSNPMVNIRFVRPRQYEEEILAMANEAFGADYFNSSVKDTDNSIWLAAFVNDDLVGFVLSYIVDWLFLNDDDLKSLFVKDKPVIYLKSIVVKSIYRRQLIASHLIGQLEKSALEYKASGIYADAWATPIGITSGLLFDKAGYKELKRIENFWYDDSLLEGYQCKECGIAPCCCSAVIYYKITELFV